MDRVMCTIDGACGVPRLGETGLEGERVVVYGI